MRAARSAAHETRPLVSTGEPPRFRHALRNRLLLALALGLGISIVPYAFFWMPGVLGRLALIGAGRGTSRSR